jgi:hypothetical protein
LKGRLTLSDGGGATLGEIGQRLARKALGEVATAALPETILGWCESLVARKFDGSHGRQGPRRPPIVKDVEDPIVRMAKENRSWGYDRTAGALAKLGHEVKRSASSAWPRHAATRHRWFRAQCADWTQLGPRYAANPQKFATPSTPGRHFAPQV